MMAQRVVVYGLDTYILITGALTLSLPVLLRLKAHAFLISKHCQAAPSLHDASLQYTQTNTRLPTYHVVLRAYHNDRLCKQRTIRSNLRGEDRVRGCCAVKRTSSQINNTLPTDRHAICRTC